MKGKTFTRILKWSGGIFACLVLVLAIHIYWVTRPKAPTAHTRIMARIDIKKDISADEADKITGWMYQQPGVDHVLVNPESDIVVFTFFPVKTTANTVVDNFKNTFHYPADRFMPSKEEMAAGCPAMAKSASDKFFGMVKSIF
jgi:hypothetical protein